MADGKITVDNYPIDYSVQYEKNRSEQDTSLLDDAYKVRDSVSRDSLEPSGALAIDEMFQQGTKSDSWGGSCKPDLTGYSSGKTFVTGQISPTFGPRERLDAMSIRIEGIKDEKIQQLQGNSSDKSISTTIEGQINSVENEANKLSSMIDQIAKINNDIEYVHGEIARFQKG